ncbi:putative kinase, aminoglycoside phosphotransferase (APT) family [Actinokineospora globicatena]|nr:putative kinase, aminoglycoside phosphotransferase (APT) family [Actinokineospora globicatena]GLW79640.1 aminoglycoside phosphotransferase [Actinokineospora globicatena]GLW85950.1 aminoglycoside phosphotransferase [Actinokineospora globicatena]
MDLTRGGDLSAGDTSSTEVTITTALVRDLVAAQFPQWADLPVAPVSTQGVDNATYHLGADMSVRLPRFARWEGQVEREQTWLPRLAPHLPLTVSQPLERGVPGQGYPLPWSIYRWLDGDRVDPDRLDERQAATDLAAFLGALWSIDTAGGPPPEWSNGFRGVDLDDVSYSPVVAWVLQQKIDALVGVVDTDAITAVWERGLAAPKWARPGVWIHGDPAASNLLGDGPRITAVIDFGTLAVGDPASDLIAAWTVLTPRGRDVFRAALDVDDATWARGRVWGLSGLLPGPGGPLDRQRLEALLTD